MIGKFMAGHDLFSTTLLSLLNPQPNHMLGGTPFLGKSLCSTDPRSVAQPVMPEVLLNLSGRDFIIIIIIIIITSNGDIQSSTVVSGQ